MRGIWRGWIVGRLIDGRRLYLELPFFLQLLPLRFVALEFPVQSWFAVHLSWAGRYLEELSLVKGRGQKIGKQLGDTGVEKNMGLGVRFWSLFYHSVAK